MLRYHTLNYLTEPVYVIDDRCDEEDKHYKLSSFFNDLMTRRRDDEKEEGLQAGGVIYPDKAGFKISERDGHASHAQTQENVAQYLNGETSFSSEEAIGMIGLRRKDPNCWVNIARSAFTVRIVAAKEDLIFIFSTDSYRVSEFQIDTISELVSYIKESYEAGIIKYPFINYISGNDRFIFDVQADIDEQLEKLETILTKKKDHITKKTR